MINVDFHGAVNEKETHTTFCCFETRSSGRVDYDGGSRDGAGVSSSVRLTTKRLVTERSRR